MHRIGSSNISLNQETKDNYGDAKQSFGPLNVGNILEKLEISKSSISLPQIGNSSSDSAQLNTAHLRSTNSTNHAKSTSVDTYNSEFAAINSTPTFQDRHGNWHMVHDERKHASLIGISVGARFPGTRILHMFLSSMDHAAVAFIPNNQQVSEVKTPFDRDVSTLLEAVTNDLDHYQNISRNCSNSLQQFSETEWNHLLFSLTRRLFEEKWLDIAMGELSSELGRCSIEQETLMNSVRSKSIEIINALVDLVKLMLKKMDDNAATQDRVLNENAHLQSLMDSADQIQNEAICRIRQSLEADHKNEVDTIARELARSQKQVSNMNDALKTLSAMTKAMEADYEFVSFSDERNRAEVAEKRVKELEIEVEYARIAKREEMLLKGQLAGVREDLVREKEKSAKQAVDIQGRDAIINDLIEREAKREAELAHIKLSMQDSQAMDDSNDATSQDTNIKKLEEQLAQVPTAVLCVKCKKSLDDIANVAASLIGRGNDTGGNPNLDFKNGYQRLDIVCQSFRSMLPNLGFDTRPGLIPTRSLTWTRSCIRAILMAKVMDNGMIQNSHETNYKPRRFPEFAYSYFYFNPTERRVLDALGLPDPSVIDLASSKESKENKGSAETLSWNKVRRQVQRRSDEDRWTFYYGMKSIAKEYSDAKLFYSLLDDAYSEDYESFIIYCLSMLYRTEGKCLIAQLGPAFCSFDSLQLREKFGHDCLIGTIKDNSVEARYSGTTFETDMSSFNACDIIWVRKSKLEEMTKKIFSKATEAELSRILDTMKQIESKATDPSQLDMFSWVRLMGQFYLLDQSKRNAAIKLMFDTAWTGAMTTFKPTDDGATQEGQEISTVDMLQFDAILRSVNNDLSCNQVAQLFVDSHRIGNGKVSASSFHHAADASRFFTQCLKLPSFLTIAPELITHEIDENEIIVSGSDEQSTTSSQHDHEESELHDLKALHSLSSTIVDLDEKTSQRHQLGALVHYHLALLSPQIESMCEMLSEASRSSIRLAVSETHRAIEESRVTDMMIDGVRPFTAYRRLLMQCLQARVQHQESFAFRHILASPRSVQLARLEMEHMERILQAFRVDARMEAFLRVRRMVAVIRTQRAWRKRISVSPGQAVDTTKTSMPEKSVIPAIPISIRRLLKQGYVLGKDMNARRKIVHQPAWVMATISDIMHNVLVHDKSQNGPHDMSMPELIIEFFYSRFGSNELSVRAMHDFFFSLNVVRSSNSRADVFSAFLGIAPCTIDQRNLSAASKRRNSMSMNIRSSVRTVSDSDLEGPTSQKAHMAMPHWQTEEAVRFYLAILLAVHKHCSRDTRCYVLSDSDGLFRASECYGVTNKPDEWKERKEDLKTVAEFVWGHDIMMNCVFMTSADSSTSASMSQIPSYIHDTLSQLFPSEFGSQCIGRMISSVKEFLEEENQLETVRISAAIDRLPTDDQDCADVDDFLLLMMQHWSRMVVRAIGWIRNYVMSIFVTPIMTNDNQKDMTAIHAMVKRSQPNLVSLMSDCWSCSSYLPFWPHSSSNASTTNLTKTNEISSSVIDVMSRSIVAARLSSFNRVGGEKTLHNLSSFNYFTALVRKACENSCPRSFTSWGTRKTMIVLSPAYDSAIDLAFPKQQSPLLEKRHVVLDPSLALQIMDCLGKVCIFYSSSSLINHEALSSQADAVQPSIISMRRELNMIWSSYERPIRALLQDIEIDAQVPAGIFHFAEKTFLATSYVVKASMDLADNSSETAETRKKLQGALTGVSHLFQLLEAMQHTASKKESLARVLVDLPSATKAATQG